jgi:carbamoyl-phosphate synthase large subunit
MRDLNVLVPSMGHPTRPSLIEALKGNGERQITIVGVDMDPEGLGPFASDRFFQVPPRTSPAYLDRILQICESEHVDVYYALGEEEAIDVTARIADFDRIGVGVIGPGSADMLRIATSKARYHEFFRDRGIPHADFRTVQSYEEVEPIIRAMGYPDVDVLLKPAISKGGRGARLVSARSREFDVPVQNLESTLDSLKASVGQDFPEHIVMEFLPGLYYSVDVLSNQGVPLYVVPKIRIRGNPSNTTVGEVDLNPEVIALATQVCQAFGFSYLQNYEMKLNREGSPRVYDINPRGGASLILCKAAGANIAYFAVKMAIGEPIPTVEIRDRVRMYRYYKEYFQYPDPQP